MSVSQISVFTQSKPGHLCKILKAFNDASVSVKGYSVSDTGDYGIARFIVDDIDVAIRALQEKNDAFTVTDVLCFRLEDEPGELARIFEILANHEINVKYSYSMISTYVILNTDDIDKAKKSLRDEGIETIAQAHIAAIESMNP